MVPEHPVNDSCILPTIIVAFRRARAKCDSADNFVRRTIARERVIIDLRLRENPLAIKRSSDSEINRPNNRLGWVCRPNSDYRRYSSTDRRAYRYTIVTYNLYDFFDLIRCTLFWNIPSFFENVDTNRCERKIAEIFSSGNVAVVKYTKREETRENRSRKRRSCTFINRSSSYTS